LDSKAHWEGIYGTKDHTQVSWFAEHVQSSLDLIDPLALRKNARILDVGGGASTLVDDLLSRDFADITVLDLSAAALEIAGKRLGPKAEKVEWIAGDILDADLGPGKFDLWHDRAVLHFLTAPEDRRRYRDRLENSLTDAGYAVLSVFADDGPLKCSGIEVHRSSVEDLEALLGPGFRTVLSKRSEHVTPSGSAQRFVHLVSRKSDI
jgi:SAM-dependent methyltransferase